MAPPDVQPSYCRAGLSHLLSQGVLSRLDITVVQKGSEPSFADPGDIFELREGEEVTAIDLSDVVKKVCGNRSAVCLFNYCSARNEDDFYLEVTRLFAYPAHQLFADTQKKVKDWSKDAKGEVYRPVVQQLRGVCELAKGLFGEEVPEEFSYTCWLPELLSSMYKI